MENYPHINKSSWFRMGIIVSLLLLWTLGITFFVSYVSPLDKIVETAPLDQKEADNATKEIARLTLQRDSASVLNLYAKNLHEKYLEVSERLKKALVLSQTMTTKEAFQGITDTVSSEDINVGLNLLGSNTSSGNKILNLFYSIPYTRSNETTKAIKNIYVDIWEPFVGISETIRVELNEDVTPVDLSLLMPGDPVAITRPRREVISSRMSVGNEENKENNEKPDTYFKDKYTPIVFGSRSRSNYSRRVSNLLPDIRSSIAVTNEYDRQEANAEILKWISTLKSEEKTALKNKLQSVYQEIHTALDLHVAELKNQVEFFKKEKEAYEIKLDGLQKRLRSSDSLFYVATVRAFLVTVVVISIGFVLIRAFAAELTQMRRMSYLEISSDMAAKYAPEKLPLIPELVRAVGGDKGGKSVVSDGAPPDAITVAESLGNAVSRFSKAAKP